MSSIKTKKIVIKRLTLGKGEPIKRRMISKAEAAEKNRLKEIEKAHAFKELDRLDKLEKERKEKAKEQAKIQETIEKDKKKLAQDKEKEKKIDRELSKNQELAAIAINVIKRIKPATFIRDVLETTNLHKTKYGRPIHTAANFGTYLGLGATPKKKPTRGKGIKKIPDPVFLSPLSVRQVKRR